MKLSSKYILYITIVHTIFAFLTVLMLWGDFLWMAAVLFLLIMSFMVGSRLTRATLGPVELIRDGTQFLNERDFTSRFQETGHPEMDQLVHIYNRMADNLREERTRLQEHHYLMESILKVSPSGILILDFDGNIVVANPVAERMLQSSFDEVLGLKLSELKSPFGDTLAHLEVADSRIIPILGGRRVRCRRVEFIDRGFQRSFISMEELTEELRQTEKAAYEKLIRIMSHEVNNTTGAVSSLLQSCLHYAEQVGEADRGDFETAVDIAINRIGLLNAFMGGFADVVRLPPPNPTSCDLKKMLEDLERLMQPELKSKEIAWDWDIEEKPGAIAMDPIQMEQVFVNIVKNSIEAIEDGGRITVTMGRKNDRVFVAIEDTGRGMTEDVQSNLFVPFFSTKPNGQGIGLTLVKEILGNHRFDFVVDSRPGGPTLFSIFF